MSYDIKEAFLASKSYGVDAANKGQTIAGPNGSQWLVVDTSRESPAGYQGALLKNVDTGKYELVSRGTELDREPLKDGRADLQMGLGQLPDQVADARAFLKASVKGIVDDGGNPNTDLSLTGHSLGGSITQVLGAENPQLQATAFNPYGVGNLVPAGAYPNITNHVMAQDFVSVLPGSKMIGKTEMYAEPGNSHGDAALALNSHYASNFLLPDVASQTGKLVTIDVTPSALKPLELFQSVNPNIEISEGRLDANTLLPKQSDTVNTANTSATYSNEGHNHPTSVYDFANTAGAGRGPVNPDAVTPPTQSSTAYNSATALPNPPSGGEGAAPAYIIQSGDTVGSVAAKLGISTQEYTDYLHSVYGAKADLNSIVAGRELPVPPNAPFAGNQPASGNAATPGNSGNFTAHPSSDNDFQPGSDNGEAAAKPNAFQDALIDTFGQAEQTAAAIKTRYAGVQVADAEGAFFDPSTDKNNANTASETAAPVDQAAASNALAARVGNATALFSSVVGLTHWSDMTDVQRAAAASVLYDTVDRMNGGALPGELSGVGSGLALFSALDRGDAGGVVVSGIAVANALGENVTSNAIASTLGMSSAANVMPGIALALNGSGLGAPAANKQDAANMCCYLACA